MTDKELLSPNEVAIITDLNIEKYADIINALSDITESLHLEVHNIYSYSELIQNAPIEEAALWINWNKEESFWKEHNRFILLFEFFNFSSMTLMQKYLQLILHYFKNNDWLSQKEIYCVILTKNTDINYHNEINLLERKRWKDLTDKRRLWNIKPFQKWAESINARYIYPTVIIEEDPDICNKVKEVIILSLLKKQKIIIRQKHKVFYTEKIYDR